MSVLKNNSRVHARTEEILKERLRQILPREDWTPYRDAIKKIAGEFELGFLDCAAAMAFLAINGQPDSSPARKPIATPKLKMLRYRLEVGRKHQATEDGIKKLLIEESGVEKRLIGRIDIYNEHTLIQLPDGMPGEIYRHLKSVLLNRQPLRIKRLDGNPEERATSSKHFRHRKRSQPQPHTEQVARQGKRDVSRRQKD
jgi:ATP-dependent RNA helicase DeaD